MTATISPSPSSDCESEDHPRSDLTDQTDTESDDSDSAAEVVPRIIYPKWSVAKLTELMASFEWANLKLKDKSQYGRLQLYGAIELITHGAPFFLYRRSKAEADTVTPSSENDGEGFNFPLSFPDWSLDATSIPAIHVALYERGGGRKPLFFETFNLTRSVKGNIIRSRDWDKDHEPIYKVIDTDRATFTLCFTRISCAQSVFVSFRAVNCADDTDYNGEWVVSGTIKATQTFMNGVSRMLTLFHSTSEVKVPPGRSIPLVRPVVIVPVNTDEVGKAGEGGFVRFNFGLNLKKGARADDNIVQGEATLKLEPHHKREHPFYLTINDSMHKRKFSSSNDDGLKIKIMITAFRELLPEFFDNPIKEWAL